MQKNKSLLDIANSKIRFSNIKKNYLPLLLVGLTLTIAFSIFKSVSNITPADLTKSDSTNAQMLTKVVAFPGAEGFGAETIGGRGGKVMEVTNLNDTGVGSLRACAEASGPRTCVFHVGGTIETQSAISIKNPYITIAGQTAPGGGITLKASPGYEKGSLTIRTNNVIIRYLRFRPGPTTALSSMRRGISIESASSTNTTHHIILDHCSISWATDDNLTLIDGVRDMTVQWSIIAEGLSQSTHSEGEHSKGLAISGKMFNSTVKTGNISVHHNLLAHNRDRNPRHAAWDTVDLVNNVMYNWGHVGFEANDAQTKVPANIVGNYFKRGPSTSTSQYEVHVDADNGHGATLYVEGNIGPNRPADTDPQENIVRPTDRQYITSTRFEAPPITTTTAQEAYEQVLKYSGVRIPLIDSVDERIVSNVKNGTGRIIDDPSQVGGWPTIASGTTPADTDHDGMPDQWETTRGLNPSADDSANDQNSDGYTNLEEYLAYLANPDMTQPYISTSPVPSASSTTTYSPTITPAKTPLVTSNPTPTNTPTTTKSPTTGNITLTPTDDAYVLIDKPNSNFGKSTRLEVDGKPIKIFYLKFNLNNNSILNSTISSALLKLRVFGSSNSSQQVQLLNDRNWSEQTLTYQNRPTQGNTIATIPGGRSGNWVQINLTNTVKATLGQTLSLSVTQSGTDGFDIYSKEYPQYTPQLVIAIQ